MNEKVYESYLKKCKELGIKPTAKANIFAEDILREKNEKRIDIASLSQARKQKAPVLSQTAKEALAAPIKRKPKQKKEKPVKQKIAAAKPKVAKPPKEPKVRQGDEEKRENVRKYSRLYYENNKEKLKALREKREKNAKIKAKLTDEEKKANARKYSRLYHLARKDDPAYQARRKASSAEWNNNNRDKIAAANKKYRDEVRTPEQLEEKRKKAREYRARNIEHMREKDRARKDQRREYLNNNPEAKARRRESERKRYAESMSDADKAEKLREKWRRDGERKRAKIKNRSAA